MISLCAWPKTPKQRRREVDNLFIEELHFGQPENAPALSTSKRIPQDRCAQFVAPAEPVPKNIDDCAYQGSRMRSFSVADLSGYEWNRYFHEGHPGLIGSKQEFRGKK